MGPALRTGIAAALLGAASVAVLAGLDARGRHSRAYAGPAFPFASARRVVVERPEEAVTTWREAGLRGRIVVAVAGRWDRIVISLFGPAWKESHYPVVVSNVASERSAKLDSANFLYVASLDGIAREVIAVLPVERYLERLPPAHGPGGPPAEIVSTFEGFRRVFTTLPSLRLPAEPVLVYLSASAFEGTGPADVEAALSRAGATTDLVVLCLETGDPRVSDGARERLLALASPAAPHRPVPPTGEGASR